MTVYSSLYFVFLCILFFKNDANAGFNFRPPRSTCVWTEKQLRKVIASAAQSSNETRTRITICRPTIYVSNTPKSPGMSGIDVSNRFIDIRCKFKPSEGGCTLDGKGSSRIFYGAGADLKVINVHFVNAIPNDDEYGGAVYFNASSKVTFTGCSFMNNGRMTEPPLSASWGGAIYVVDSSLTVNGGSTTRPVMFSGNIADNAGALSADIANVTFDGYTIFSNNEARINGGAIYIFLGSAYFKNVQFYKNVGNETAALYIDRNPTTLQNVDFIENFSDNPTTSAAYVYVSSLQATHCTFTNHKIVALSVEYSNVTLQNSKFSKNKSENNNLGSDIYILDDDDVQEEFVPGSFVKCLQNTVFCNGLGNSSIYETLTSGVDVNKNTDCKTTGTIGTPGEGTCPN